MSKKTKFKLTNDVHKHIKEISELLPKMQRADKNTGKPLFRSTTTFKGIVIENGKKYKSFDRGTEPVMVNHEIVLIGEFEKHGMQGIVDYKNYVLAMSEKSKKEQAEKNNTGKEPAIEEKQ